MNAQTHALIFTPHRSSLIPVSESARRCEKGQRITRRGSRNRNSIAGRDAQITAATIIVDRTIPLPARQQGN
ncbi:MAG: hypothetical protein LBU43_03075 [Candidatus Accumulibacter sp.]|jgi:hypothetical protein|nr:hypothetical protein [Accumulibacter sp.]